MTDGDRQILWFIAKLLSFRPSTLADDDAYHDDLLTLLMILCPEQHWHYLQLLCFSAARHGNPAFREEFFAQLATRETLVQMLAYNHRINQALHFHLYHEGRVEEARFAPRLPARRWNFPGTDRWVTAETICAMLDEIHRRAATLPPKWRIPWASSAVMRACRKCNNRLKDAALWKLTQHGAALNSVRWKRLTAAAPPGAIHVRLHLSTGFFTATIRVGSKMASRRRMIGNLLLGSLTREEFQSGDTHIFVRLLSGRIFELLVMLREADPAKTEMLDQWLRDLYRLLLQPLLERPDIAGAIAGLGERPTLVIATHGAFSQIPFAALHDGTQYLLERFDIVQAPPIYDPAEFGGGILDDDAMTGGEPMSRPFQLRVLADTSAAGGLAATALELGQYRDLLGGGEHGFEHVGADGHWSAETLLRLFGEKGVAVLSAHVRPSIEGGAGLAIETPDGRILPIAAALDRIIAADLVLLAGCGSVGQTDWVGGEEDSLVSLCRRRGARAVVGTLWPINDMAAAHYNNAVAAALAAGRSRAQAHGDAQRSVRRATALHNGSHERLVRRAPAGAAVPVATFSMQHPYFWAPFVLYGAWS